MDVLSYQVNIVRTFPYALGRADVCDDVLVA